jgi:Na+-transporting NADH:ubiquinone oxidoreductase subunit C
VNKEGMIYTIVFIFTVSFAFVFLLSMTNQATIEQVRLNQELARQRAVLSAMGIEFETDQEVMERFDEIAADPVAGLYVGQVEDRTVYAREFSGSGLWGLISGIAAVTADLEQFIGIEIVDDNETPGLGGRINEEWYKAQFEGLPIPEPGIRVRMGNPDLEAGIIDGVTGATGTSMAMQSIINRVIDDFRSPAVQSRIEELAAGADR